MGYEVTLKMCNFCQGKGVVVCASVEKKSKLVTKVCFFCGGKGKK